ncbi:MAG: cupin domain-containing protein [Gammaproteobacteria bacterium]|nr:cupin domain-containing protein [Gammaproteobacteria bacterium]
MAEFFNTGLSQQDFLEQYWQKKPLVIRQALKQFKSPISPEDLAGLACEPDIESRLIQEFGSQGSWQVRHGPFSEQDFETLPATHWTLLVQDVDKHVPDTQAILDPFRFIPDWRRDDLMISYAPEHGTVGPHTDGYDVFLLQAMGTRRWQISDQPLIKPDLLKGLDLQILAEFDPDHTWDLHAGDILYLPPYFAHHGVALNDCMTFSVGFRAPSQTDMLDAVINSLLEHNLATGRYHDPDLLVAAHQSEIDPATIARLKQLLHQTIEQAEPVLAEALGNYVSETKSSLAILAEEAITDTPGIDDISQEFELGHTLKRNLYYRFAWTAYDDYAQLFLAGVSYRVDKKDAQFLPMLTENPVITHHDWQHIITGSSLAELLCQLIAEGGWYWQES